MSRAFELLSKGTVVIVQLIVASFPLMLVAVGIAVVPLLATSRSELRHLAREAEQRMNNGRGGHPGTPETPRTSVGCGERSAAHERALHAMARARSPRDEPSHSEDLRRPQVPLKCVRHSERRKEKNGSDQPRSTFTWPCSSSVSHSWLPPSSRSSCCRTSTTVTRRRWPRSSCLAGACPPRLGRGDRPAHRSGCTHSAMSWVSGTN